MDYISGSLPPSEEELLNKKLEAKIRNDLIDEICLWCEENSFVDYEEEFSDNGNCLIILSKLKKFLDNLRKNRRSE